MSLLSAIFNPSAAPAAAPIAEPVPQPAGTAKIDDAAPGISPVQTPGTDANGVVPDNAPAPESPLAEFATLWDTPTEGSVPTPYVPEKLDPTKMQELVSGVNLTNTVTAEQLAAVQAGGEGASDALMQVMNTVAQQSLAQSTNIANTMVEQQVGNAIKSLEERLPAMLKEQNLSNSLLDQNPIYSNPAVAPVIDAVKSQLAIKNPNATDTQLLSMAQDFIKAMGAQLSPVQQADPGALPSGETDWSNFENL